MPISLDEWAQSGRKNILPDPRLIENQPYDPTEGMSTYEKAAAGAGKFLVDQGRGIRQLGVDALASGMPSNPLGLNEYSAQLRQEEDQRKQQDKPLMSTKAGQAGYVGGGLITNLALGRLPGMGTLLSPTSLAGAGLSGAAQGAIQPVGTNDSRARNVGVGAVTGVLANAAAQTPGRIVQPVQDTSASAKTLLQNDVVPTPGQAVDRNTIGGRIAAGAEEKAQSIPIIGDFISNARQRAVVDLNKAALARAGGQGAGNEAIDSAHTALNNEFTNLAKNSSVDLNNTFHVNLSDLTLTDDARKIIQKKLDDVFNAANNGTLDGAAYSKFRGELGAAGTRYIRSPLPADHDLGFALRRISEGLDNAFAAQAPAAQKAAWDTARSQWKNLMVVENAASKAIGNDGVFSPSQLNQAVRNAGGQSQAARGTANMQDLSGPGSVLISKTPDSGTAGRLGWMGLLGGGSYLTDTLPELAAGGAALGGLYGLRPVTKWMVGGYPMQQPTVGALNSYLVPGATQSGILYRKASGQ